MNTNGFDMIKRTFAIAALVLFCILPARAQVDNKSTGPKREVTLYNPYKPSLSVVQKRNFLPELDDTLRYKPEFRYEVTSEPFQPEYQVSPIKAAALSPDPLSKLYRSSIKLGLGNYLSPLAEISITNERSKKGAIGFYGRHFSNNGNVKLPNDRKVYAGYMDNEASLFGRKFFKSAVLGGSLDLQHMTRYAYGYDTSIIFYAPANKDIRLPYLNAGFRGSLSSLNLDSAKFSYDFDIFYNFFTAYKDLVQHNGGFSGKMSKQISRFYAGAGVSYEYFRVPSIVTGPERGPKYIFALNPYIRNSSDQWSFRLGLQAVLERNLTDVSKLHIYPDLYFGFSIVPEYLGFFTSLTGKLEKNDPLNVINENPFLYPDGSLFALPNTDHKLVAAAGIKGKTGLKGNYLLSVSYSVVNNMLLYTNLVFPDSIPLAGFDNIPQPGSGNYFGAVTDDAEVLNLHAEIRQDLTDKLKVNAGGNYNSYTLSRYEFAWNKPGWDAVLGFKYNLRDKILAGAELTAIGTRKMIVNGQNPVLVNTVGLPEPPLVLDFPAHMNLNLSAEYRYSKILSFWAKLNNLSYNRYYEWAYYPSKRFFFMLGFTYSL